MKQNVPHLDIITHVCYVDETGCIHEPFEIKNKQIVSSVDEWRRLKKNFWEVLALILIDTCMPSPKQIDEITGHPGYRFGKKIKGFKNV